MSPSPKLKVADFPSVEAVTEPPLRVESTSRLNSAYSDENETALIFDATARVFSSPVSSFSSMSKVTESCLIPGTSTPVPTVNFVELSSVIGKILRSFMPKSAVFLEIVRKSFCLILYVLFLNQMKKRACRFSLFPCNTGVVEVLSTSFSRLLKEVFHIVLADKSNHRLCLQ